MTARVSRRRFLQASAGAVAGLSLTTLDRAPALAQKRELTFLSWNHFVPAADDELRRQAEAFSKQAGVTVRVDTIAHLQLPAKRAAEAQSQSGHDMLLTGGADPFLYREPARRHRRPRRRSRQEVRRLVPVRGRVRPDQVRLEGRALVLDLVPGHLQHGPLQEGRPRVPEDLGRAAPARQDPQEAGQPRRHRHQPLRRRQHHLLVDRLVPRRQGARGRRQDAGHQLRQDRAGDRVLQGALPGRHGSRGAVLGRRLQQPRHPLRQVLLDPQPDQPLQRRPQGEDADRRRHQSPSEPGRSRRHALRTAHQHDQHLEVLQEHPAGHGVPEVPLPEGELRRLDRGRQRLQPSAPAAPRRPSDLGPQSQVRDAAQGGGVRPSSGLAGQAQRRGRPDRGQLRAARHGCQGRERHAHQAGDGVGAGAGGPGGARASSRTSG